MFELEEAFNQMNLLYGVEMDDDDFIDIALIAWKRIGNKITRLYKYCVDVSCTEHEVELPCNVDTIEAVLRPGEDWNYTTSTNVLGDYNSAFTEEYIENLKRHKDPLYQRGRYIPYKHIGDKLYLDNDCGPVMILYKGIEVDDEGLPYITDKEKDAIACFCAYIAKFKQGMATQNNAIIQESQILQNEWKRLCDAARVKESLSQNEGSKILDAHSSWNRKLYGKSYKPIQ